MRDSKLKTFLRVLTLVYGLWSMVYGLAYGQDDYLEVKGDTRTDTLTFSGQNWTFPSTPVIGEVFYNSTDNLPYYFDGTEWLLFGGGGPDRAVASLIVAASDSLDTSRADRVCTGTQTTGGDEVVINQAISDIVANGTGGAVYLLEGHFWISDSINVPSGVSIIGAGAGTVISLKNSAPLNNRGVITNADLTNGNSYILLQNFKIDGNKVNNSGTQYGIIFGRVTHSKIDKAWVENMKATAIILSNSSNNNTISGSTLCSNSTGIGLINSSNNNTISGSTVWSNSNGISLFFSSNNNTISGSTLCSNSTAIILSNSSNNNTISGSTVWSNSSIGVYFGSSSYNTITSNNIQSNALGVSLISSPYNTITNNNIQSNACQGIYLTSSSNNILSGNVIYDNGGTGNYEGILIANTSNNNIISSNLLYDSDGTGYPINIISAATCDNNYLVGNHVSYWWTVANSRINDSGTNTQYTDKVKMTLERRTTNLGFSPYSLNVSEDPRSYVYLNPTTTTDITLNLLNGKSAGDLLILENGSATYTVTISEAGNVNLGAASRPLRKYDTLKLIWNGSRWLEMDYVDN